MNNVCEFCSIQANTSKSKKATVSLRMTFIF